MCSFARSTRRRCSFRSGKRRSSPRRPVPRGVSGCGPSSSRVASSGSPTRTSATPRAWSKRTSSSGTTNRLSSKPGPVLGQAHCRLEPRDDVVAEVPDDRLAERLRLVERRRAASRDRRTSAARAARARPTRAERPRGAPSRRRRYAPRGVRRSVAISLFIEKSMEKAPFGALESSGVGVLAPRVAQRMLPPRSERQTHQLRETGVISAEGRRAAGARQLSTSWPAAASASTERGRSCSRISR